MKEKLINNLADLLKVKSLVTIAVTIVFSTLALKQIMPHEEVSKYFGLIIAFFFGTQFEKKNGNTKD